VKLYISTLAAWLLAIVYAPLMLFLVWKLWQRLKLSAVKRVAACVGVLLVAAAIPLWDVLITSYYMAQLCTQAGVFVNRSVKVDGYLTNFGVGASDILRRGFNYLEVKDRNRIVLHVRVNETIKGQEHDVTTYLPKSRYEIIRGQEVRWSGRRDIGVITDIVRDRATGEELGQAIIYYAFPGWLDRNTIALLGQVLWACPSNPSGYPASGYLELEKRVLLPKQD
jgi:hypothetical protein